MSTEPEPAADRYSQNPMATPDFPLYDPNIAAGLRGSAAAAGGLASFLAIEHVEVGPGELHAQVVVRDELLTPFRNLHGGVLAALCDHVLGTVLYPVIPRGAWAATTEFKINYLAPVTTGIWMPGQRSSRSPNGRPSCASMSRTRTAWHVRHKELCSSSNQRSERRARSVFERVAIPAGPAFGCGFGTTDSVGVGGAGFRMRLYEGARVRGGASS